MRSTSASPRVFIVASSLALALTACTAPLDYGEPVPPTADQVEAADLITDLALSVDDARSGSANPVQVFEAHSLMARIPALAVRGSRNPITADGRVPPGIDPGCVSGDPRSGYTYTNCVTDNGTINGQVKVTPLTVEYDLRISSAEGGVNEFNMLGDFNVGDGLILGSLEFRSQVNLAGQGDVAGISPGQTVGDVNTVTQWNVRFDEVNGCISDGVVEVEVEAKGKFDGARFAFEGCDAPPLVENGNQSQLRPG